MKSQESSQLRFLFNSEVEGNSVFFPSGQIFQPEIN